LRPKGINVKYLAAGLTLAVLAVTPAYTQRIDVTPNGTHTTMLGPPQAYTGHAVAEVLFAANDQSPLEGVVVTFSPGSHTAWHNHPKGQYLIITSGVGWVQEQGGPIREVKAGDVVWTPPGVYHWHGATTKTAMSHIAIWEFGKDSDGKLSGGKLLGPVSEDEYLGKTNTPPAAK
jgi:quercetin dioxygenase-like cupin family protein